MQRHAVTFLYSLLPSYGKHNTEHTRQVNCHRDEQFSKEEPQVDVISYDGIRSKTGAKQSKAKAASEYGQKMNEFQIKLKIKQARKIKIRLKSIFNPSFFIEFCF